MRITEINLPNISVTELIAACERVDLRKPVNELGELALAGARDATCLGAFKDDVLLGMALVDHRENTVSLAVHPDHRRKGVGTLLGTGASEHDQAGVWWAFGNQPGAQALASKLGLVKVRELLRMARPLGEADPQSDLPGMKLGVFQPDQASEVVQLNARAFANHPEQGNLTLADFETLTGQAWFDPSGLITASRDDKLVGFHWTKVHDSSTGEVYVLAVDPDHEGQGIGRILLMAGLEHLRKLGLRNVLLYVESSSKRVVQMYQAAGFLITSTDASYRAVGR